MSSETESRKAFEESARTLGYTVELAATIEAYDKGRDNAA